MENINLELYKIFCCVASNKNITKASVELMISQPGITQAIKKLEDQIGYKLFFRCSRGVELTDMGSILYSNIKNSIGCLNICKNELDSFSSMNKTLRIGGGTILLKHNAVDALKKFKKKFPDTRIEITKDITSELFRKLDCNILDLVLFTMPFNYSENIEVLDLDTVQDTFVADSATFGYLKDKSLKISDIASLPLVLQSIVSSSRKYLNNICLENNVTLHESYEVESYELVISFIKAGLGIGFVNKSHVINELNDGTLFELNVDYEILPRKIGVAFNKKKVNNIYIKEFINALKKD